MKSIRYTKNVFELFPRKGIGIFQFGYNIYSCGRSAFTLYRDISEDALAAFHPDIPNYRTYYLNKYYRKLSIYTTDDDIIESFNTDILYHHGKLLTGVNIELSKKALQLKQWDNIEDMEVCDEIQTIYYCDKFGLMLWTILDKVKNISVYNPNSDV